MRSVALWLAGVLPMASQLVAQEANIGEPPGQLVRVGERVMHLDCAGTGSPTVVIEAGASSFAIDFALVQPSIAEFTRACSYDRLGHGWSDPGDGRDAGVAETLRSLLHAAGESPPYVLLGASRGGLYVRVYTHLFPGEVAGLVLVDPAHEDRLLTVYQGETVPIASLSADELSATLTPGPVAIPRRQSQAGPPFDRLPPSLYRTRVALDAKLIASYPDTVPFSVVARAVEEERALLAELRNLSAAVRHPLGARPLTILSRGVGTNEDRLATFDRLAGLSSKGRHTIVAGSGHEIHLFDPDAVIGAVRDVVNAVRSDGMRR